MIQSGNLGRKRKIEGPRMLMTCVIPRLRNAAGEQAVRASEIKTLDEILDAPQRGGTIKDCRKRYNV